MLTTIYLPAGTERVYLRDVPGLFADALHPEIPEHTPRVLSYLQKEATDSKLASQWCGINNNFPLSLTEQDVRELNGGVWRHLPPLGLLRDTGEGPQKVATLLPEPQWKQYADAFAASPPEGWRLIAVWRNPVMEQWVMNDEARKDWKRLLVQQATAGKLTPRAHVSGIPTPHMAGHQLMDAFFTVAELTEFAHALQVEVLVAEQGPAAKSVPVADDAPLPLTTGDIAFCFAGLRGWDESKWKKSLGNKPKWLEACIAIPGQRGVSERRWNPVLIAAELVRVDHAQPHSVRARFQSKPMLKPWLDTWKTYEADHIDND